LVSLVALHGYNGAVVEGSHAPGAPAKRHDYVMKPRGEPTGRRTAGPGHSSGCPRRETLS